MGQRLAGRDAELGVLRLWLAGRTGSGRHGPPVALVSGEAGVGKTVLVESVLAGHADSVRDEAGRDAFVGRGAGSPWYPAAFGVLRAAVPGWDGTPEPAALRGAILEAAAGRPGVLFLDDLHWSDEASLELLAGLAEAVALGIRSAASPTCAGSSWCARRRQKVYNLEAWPPPSNLLVASADFVDLSARLRHLSYFCRSLGSVSVVSWPGGAWSTASSSECFGTHSSGGRASPSQSTLSSPQKISIAWPSGSRNSTDT